MNAAWRICLGSFHWDLLEPPACFVVVAWAWARTLVLCLVDSLWPGVCLHPVWPCVITASALLLGACSEGSPSRFRVSQVRSVGVFHHPALLLEACPEGNPSMSGLWVNFQHLGSVSILGIPACASLHGCAGKCGCRQAIRSQHCSCVQLALSHCMLFCCGPVRGLVHSLSASLLLMAFCCQWPFAFVSIAQNKKQNQNHLLATCHRLSMQHVINLVSALLASYLGVTQMPFACCACMPVRVCVWGQTLDFSAVDGLLLSMALCFCVDCTKQKTKQNHLLATCDRLSMHHMFWCQLCWPVTWGFVEHICIRSCMFAVFSAWLVAFSISAGVTCLLMSYACHRTLCLCTRWYKGR
jgi:hypothetical protein